MRTIHYSKWIELTIEEQNDYIAEGVLPYVPTEDLRNCLLMSQMVIVDGKRYWEIRKRGGRSKIYPEFTSKVKLDFTLWCKLNPMWGDYRMSESPLEMVNMESIYFGDSHWNIWLVGND